MVTPTHGLYLADGWTESVHPLDVRNPATGEVIARVGTLDRGGVQSALIGAEAAWKSWRQQTGKQRGVVLRRIAAIIERRKDEFARIVTLENGKPLRESQAEVAAAVDHLEWFAEEARRTYGRVVPHQVAGKRHLVLKQPIGVAGLIAPWNFPLMLAVRKLAPALAAGCPVLLKPASATPLSGVALAEAIDEAELPRGVFQILLGDAAEIGAELLENPRCRKISFTGSTAVGRKLIAGAADQVTKLSLELGGHAPVLVFDDADLDTAVAGTLAAKMRNTGQSCIAANRLYVQATIYDRFVSSFTTRVRALRIGDGLDPETDVGPLINADALDNALAHVREACDRGGLKQSGWSRELGVEGIDAFLETKHISLGLDI